ncbi:glutamic-type intramembrane protease PrsW [Brevibacillus dissolubilis]|uniref:glutamic-type intramembrane protease PrsW n=1 Tax=Brevibacillus dissolubilis TaxID=1844116 RepID=UPI0011179EB3|nr:glutamic-type intramembrane protease PrsW [Brevibacillus dissolubilis]
MIALIGAAIAPGIALLSYFYLRDTLEPEPISMVIREFIFGVLLAFPIMVIQYIIQTEWGLTNEYSHAIINSAMIEEFFKWLVVFLTAYKHVEFDEPYDGIVYSVAISLGFATLENFFYLILNGEETALWRALLPVSSHALFGVWMGYYFGLGKFTDKPNRKQWKLVAAFVIPFVFHCLYNLTFTVMKDEWWLVIVPFMIFLWYHGLKKVQLAHDYGSKKADTRPH